ncbi:MAG TPA: helix-turn-helix domain-containing protein [Polyangiaceae bacterium]|nr:helix-turn-helix domain-containing protein [Polyangiaceae bacterium]
MGRTNRVRPRREATQARSQDTVDVILVATDRVLARVGLNEATTREIADVAGVSIGTLYRYFPSKDALFLAMLQRRWGEETQALGRLMAKLADERASLRKTIEHVVLWTIDAIDRTLGRYRTHGDIEAGFVLMTGPDQLNQVARIVARALEPFRERLWPEDLHLAAVLVVRTVLLLGRVGRRDYPEAFEQGAFAREVSQLVVRYLVKPRS